MATLSYGSKGNDVSSLQRLLNSKGYNLSVDGIFGDKTLAAVKNWQQKNGYTADGLVGPNTWQRMGGTASGSTSSSTVENIYNQLTGGTGGSGGTGSGTTGTTGTDAPATGETASTETTVSGTETEKPSTAGVEAAMEAAKNNPQLEELLKSLQVKDYTPLTAEQMKQQAENEYKSYYDQLRLAANQSAERQNLALENQKAGLQQTYDRQRRDSTEQYRQAYSQADRQSLSRGMQRSSYNNQTLANIDQKAAQAQQDIQSAQTTEENKISSQQTQLAAQLADQLLQYDASQAADIMKRIDELEAREYDRQTTAENNRNTLGLQIESILQARANQQVQYEQWLAEFNENVRQFNASQASSGGYSGGGGYYGGGYSGYSKKSYSSGSGRSGNGGNSNFLNTLANELNAGNKAKNEVKSGIRDSILGAKNKSLEGASEGQGERKNQPVIRRNNNTYIN